VAKSSAIAVPSIRPKGVTPRQWRLAVLLPRAQSSYQACVDAGYLPTGAAGNAHTYIVSKGTQSALVAIESQLAAKRDSAAAIKRKAGARVSRELDGEPDPNYALNAWATASKIHAEYPDEQHGVADAERMAYTMYLRRFARALIETAGGRELEDAEIDALATQDVVLSPALDATNGEK
jgi:hypothetical protein